MDLLTRSKFLLRISQLKVFFIDCSYFLYFDRKKKLHFQHRVLCYLIVFEIFIYNVYL